MSRFRAFIAVDIHPTAPLRSVISELHALGAPLKTTDPDNLHVTLKFLGDVEEARLGELSRVLNDAAAAYRAVQAEFVGLGVFPHAARPSVVWAGLRGADELVALSAELELGFEKLGFVRESRAFTPHVTLGRLKGRPPSGFKEIVERHRETSFGSVRIDQAVLYRSELGRSGPHYTAMATVPLKQ